MRLMLISYGYARMEAINKPGVATTEWIDGLLDYWIVERHSQSPLWFCINPLIHQSISERAASINE